MTQMNWSHLYDKRHSSEVTEDVFKVVLEKFRYTKRFKISRSVLRTMTVEEVPALEAMLKEYVYELTCHVLAEKLIDKTQCVSFDNPTTWWDMFKVRFFPGWLIRRFPPLHTLTTKYVHFQEFATYPQLKELLPESERGEVIIRNVIDERTENESIKSH